MSSPAKKPRTEGKTKQFYVNQARKQRKYLDVGDKGFLVTCNFKERDSVREVYHLLNDYHNKITKVAEPKELVDEVKQEDEEEDDITNQLQDQIDKTKQDTKTRSQKFQSIDTGEFLHNILKFVTNFCFRSSKPHLHKSIERHRCNRIRVGYHS